MSVFYGVRLSDELSARIAATGRGKSEVISAAIEKYFTLDAVGTSGGKATVEVIHPVMTRQRVKVSKPVLVKPDPVTMSSSVVEPAVSSGCGKHPGGPGWVKGGGWWCATCGKFV